MVKKNDLQGVLRANCHVWIQNDNGWGRTMLKFSDNIRAKQVLHGRNPQPLAEANPKSVSSNTSQANASRIPVKEAEIHTKITAKTRKPSPVEAAKTQEKNEHKQE